MNVVQTQTCSACKRPKPWTLEHFDWKYRREANGLGRVCRTCNARYFRVPKPRPLRGSAHPGAKLTEAEVQLILQAHEEGLSTRALAEKMEVSQSCIAQAVSARTWTHV